jgi:hypothetical protein
MAWREKDLKWIGELSAKTLERIAAPTLDLVLNGDQWVHRRVETVSFHDDRVVRRHLSIDFTLPKNIASRLTSGDGETVMLVPVTYLARKLGPMRFDVCDGEGNSLALATGRENSRVSAAVLYELAKRSLPRKLRTRLANDALSNALISVPFVAFDSAIPLIRAMMNPKSKEWQSFPGDALLRRRLLANKDYRHHLAQFAANSLAMVPVVGKPGSRKIVKVSFDEEIDNARADWTPALKTRLSIFAGFTARPVSLALPILGGAESHHVQILLPPNVELTSASLQGASPESVISTPVMDASPTNPTGYTAFEAGPLNRSHLYVPDAHEAQTARAVVGLRSERRGFFAGSVIPSFAITVLLFLYWLRADTLVNQSSSATSLLLLAPALIVALMARPGEHAMARALMIFRRALLAASAFLALGAAVALVAFAPSPPKPKAKTPSAVAAAANERLHAPRGLKRILEVEAFLSVAATIALATAFYLPRAQPKAKDS